MKLKGEIIFSIILSLQFVSSSVLEISDGRIQGTVQETRRGQPFYAFKKIPYAEPPVGERRFASPIAKQPWSEILDCRSYGPMCMQNINTWDIPRPVNEDCLFVNVFTKNLPLTANSELKPVIVFIHGGAFEFGSPLQNGPEYLMERDVVLVTLQYRLGAFGFLALETAEVSGNAGLKDQTLAFQWIQNNIRHFGGNPNKVTMTGFSAGGMSATGHMVSPMSEGLFHNLIAVSGAMPWQSKLRSNNINLAETLARRVDCPTNTIANILQCLKAVSSNFKLSLKYKFKINKLAKSNALETCRRYYAPHGLSISEMFSVSLAACS